MPTSANSRNMSGTTGSKYIVSHQGRAFTARPCAVGGNNMLIAARTHDYGKQPIDRLAGLLKGGGDRRRAAGAAERIYGDQFL